MAVQNMQKMRVPMGNMETGDTDRYQHKDIEGNIMVKGHGGLKMKTIVVELVQGALHEITEFRDERYFKNVNIVALMHDVAQGKYDKVIIRPKT